MESGILDEGRLIQKERIRKEMGIAIPKSIFNIIDPGWSENIFLGEIFPMKAEEVARQLKYLKINIKKCRGGPGNTQNSNCGSLPPGSKDLVTWYSRVLSGRVGRRRISADT
ncbi:MAG: hypothetical protein P8X58_15540 [Syntrophobacterales bacterium]